MRYLVAIDSFKGSLTSMQAGAAVQEAIRLLDKDAQIDLRPLADGGEGTVAALSAGLGGTLIESCVTGPLQNKVTAQYCILPNKNTAVIEMAAAAGLALVPDELRNPLETTTYGVGELIQDAINRGCRHFIVGIGGSATNDGGTGMLRALGFEFLDKNNAPIPLGAKGLADLAAINTEHVMPQLQECSFRIACDVTNPLCGSNGCSAIFGPQKGAKEQMVANMDRWLSRYAELAASVSPKADKNHSGSGAAGGLGFAFQSFTNAKLQSGIQIILDETRMEHYIQSADVVITGEGRLDGQTVMGKAPIGVAQLAKKYGKKVIAFAGCVTDDAALCNDHGIDAYFPILPGVVSLEEALDPKNAYRNLRNTAYQVLRLLYL